MTETPALLELILVQEKGTKPMSKICSALDNDTRLGKVSLRGHFSEKKRSKKGKQHPHREVMSQRKRTEFQTG